jgi:hypothetical protein
MDVKFLSPARDELKLAIEFYEKSSVGLGSRFLNEVKGLFRELSKIHKRGVFWMTKFVDVDYRGFLMELFMRSHKMQS